MTSCASDYRLYCLLPDLVTAQAIASDLAQTSTKGHNLRVIVRREMLVTGLAEAGVRERSAIMQAAKRGLVIGSVGGAVTGLVAIIELPVHFLLGCGLIALGIVVGSLFGAWVCAMMGIEEPHSVIRPYQQAIEAGQVLTIINVDHDQLDAIEHIVRRHHPDAVFNTVRAATISP